MGWLINLTLYTSAVLSLFVILIETEKGLKSDTATAKMRVFQIQGLKRQVFKGLQTLMSTLIKTLQFDQRFHLQIIYKQKMMNREF